MNVWLSKILIFATFCHYVKWTQLDIAPKSNNQQRWYEHFVEPIRRSSLAQQVKQSSYPVIQLHGRYARQSSLSKMMRARKRARAPKRCPLSPGRPPKGARSLLSASRAAHSAHLSKTAPFPSSTSSRRAFCVSTSLRFYKEPHVVKSEKGRF